MKVLKLERPEGDKRTDVFTTGIVSVSEGHKIALFMTGRQPAGENLGDALEHRDSGQGTPIQMCDALSRNAPKLSPGAELLLANCLAHYPESGLIQSEMRRAQSTRYGMGLTSTSTPDKMSQCNGSSWRPMHDRDNHESPKHRCPPAKARRHNCDA